MQSRLSVASLCQYYWLNDPWLLHRMEELTNNQQQQKKYIYNIFLRNSLIINSSKCLVMWHIGNKWHLGVSYETIMRNTDLLNLEPQTTIISRLYFYGAYSLGRFA